MIFSRFAGGLELWKYWILALVLIPTLSALTLPSFGANFSSNIDDERVLARSATGVPTFLAGSLGSLDTSKDLGMEAVAFLRDFSTIELRATGEEELSILRTTRDDLGYVHVRIQQRINGLAVVGAQMIVHGDALTGEVYSVNGRFVASAGLEQKADLGAEEALEVAAKEAGIFGTAVDEPELVYVLGSDEKAHLAWRTRVEYRSPQGQEIDDLFADAANGQLLARHPKVFRAKAWKTYDGENDVFLPGTLVCSNNQSCSDSIEQNVHDAASDVYDYYAAKFNRNSWNGSGAVVTSTVHHGPGVVSAVWSGAQMVFGDGDGIESGPLGNSLDVVAHEFTHGVTQEESDLIYSGESGALNEAWSDIFGAATEAWIDGGISANTWMLGEDSWTPSIPGDAHRYMNHPTLDGVSRDFYPERYTGTDDGGGVHINSGIANLAFYLAVEGGSHPRNKTTVVVTPVGLSRAEQIFYRAQTLYLTPSSNFLAARNATSQAAEDLYGATDRDRILEAWCAVGVGTCPAPPPALVAPATFTVLQTGCLGWTELIWSAATGASRYEVYASSRSSFTHQYKIYDGPRTSWLVNVAGPRRYLRVRACDSVSCGPYRNGDRSTRYFPNCF